MAYQIAFDLYESATQQFLGSVMQALRVTAPLPHILEEKLKPKIIPEVTVSAEQPEPMETKIEVKDERTVDSLVRFSLSLYTFKKRRNHYLEELLYSFNSFFD